MKTIICLCIPCWSIRQSLSLPQILHPISNGNICLHMIKKDKYMAMALSCWHVYFRFVYWVAPIHDLGVWINNVMHMLSMATVKIKKHNLLIDGRLFFFCFFYLITNFGVWLTWLLSQTIDGLIACYTMACSF